MAQRSKRSWLILGGALAVLLASAFVTLLLWPTSPSANRQTGRLARATRDVIHLSSDGAGAGGDFSGIPRAKSAQQDGGADRVTAASSLSGRDPSRQDVSTSIDRESPTGPAPGAREPSETSEAASPPPFDPEDQPRTFWNFPLGAADLTTYSLEWLQQSPDGLTLAEAQSGTGRFVRAGRLESPPIAADFPFNALTPLWRADLKPGTDFELEISVGPDGIHWSKWYSIEPEDDGPGQIRPTFPDGRVNPSYGFIPGGILAWGTTQWQYFRFRAFLYSDGSVSPTLSAFRFYYQDSTLGRGRIAAAQDILDPADE